MKPTAMMPKLAVSGGQASARVLVLLAGIALAASGCTSTGSSSTASSHAGEIGKPDVYIDGIANIDDVRAPDVINRSKARVKRTGEIYLMRGLADVFSRGIDRMADDMRARGLDAANFSYKYWQPIAADIVARNGRGEVSHPVIIVGHSLGGNESSKFANYLGSRGVKVALVVAFDPVEPGRVGANIGEVINYYLPKAKTDNRILAEEGFTGNLRNVDVTVDESITHTNVEKNPEFQAATISAAMDMTKRTKSNAVADNTIVSDILRNK